MATTLLTATASSGTSDSVGVTGANMPYNFHAAPPLEANESAHVEFLGGGGDWIALWIDGFKVQLDTSRRMVTIYAPGRYRVVKEMTGSAIGIYGNSEVDD